MGSKEDTEYERLAQEIYQALLNSEGLETIEVKHDQKIEGRSGCLHQVDVYWEFRHAGVEHRVAVECKNYSTSKVKIGHVRNFFGVLHDVGNLIGIMITKGRFQSGAISFAEHYGINLKELRFPDEEDWVGRVKDLVIAISHFTTDIKQRIPIAAPGQALQDGASIIAGLSTELEVIDANGDKITDFNKMENELPQKFQAEEGVTHTYEFNNAFMKGPNSDPIKICGVTFEYDVVAVSEEVSLHAEKITKAILKDVQSGDVKFFDIEGNVK